MVATAVSVRLRLTVTTAVTGRLRLTVTSAVSGRPNPEVNKRHSNPDFESIRHFRDLSAETMTSSMFRLWFIKLLFASGRNFHEKTIFYAQHDVAWWRAAITQHWIWVSLGSFPGVWSGVSLLNFVCLQVPDHFRITRTVDSSCQNGFELWLRAIRWFSTADILDTNRDIEEVSDSDSDSDDNVDLFGSDSDDDQ